MSSIPEFHQNDLIAMQQFHSTIKKMDECFDMIERDFINHFGDFSHKKNVRLNQVTRFNRYAIFKIYNNHNGGFIEMLVGFNFSEEITPMIYSHCFCYKKHKLYEKYKKNIKNYFENEAQVKIRENQDGCLAAFEKSISDFISRDRQYEEITEWFIEHMKKFREFMEKTPELEWDIPNNE